MLKICFSGTFSIQSIQHCFSNFILYCGCVMLETVHYGVDCVVNHALICTRLTEVYCRVTYIHISQFCNSKLLIEYYRKQAVTVNELLVHV